MTEGVVSAIISGAVTLIVCMINNNAQGIKVTKQHDKTIEIIDYRLSELSEKVEKQNSLIDRTYALEQSMALQEERIKVANHRIEDLEEKSA